MLECDILRLPELHAYDFVIKDFVIKRGGIICARLCIILLEIHVLEAKKFGN